MVDVDSLTDDELRTKLVEFGFPVMPITGTTRIVMAKKLKLLLESKGRVSSERRSLGKFSSDEDSDSSTKLVKKDKSRRVTMAVPPMQQVHKISQEETQEMVPPAPVVQKEKRKSSARSAKIIVQVQDAPDTNSDSEPEIVEPSEFKSKKIEIEVPLSKRPASIKDDSPSPIKSVESKVPRSVAATTSIASRYSTYSSPTNDLSDEMAKIRSRLSSRTDYLVHSGIRASALSDNKDSDEPAPFLSNFTRRLSQMSPRNGGSLDYDDNAAVLYSRSNYSPRPRSRDFIKPNYSATDVGGSKETNRSSTISFVLIAVVALFFAVLAALYYGMHSGNDPAGILGKTNKYEPQDSL